MKLVSGDWIVTITAADLDALTKALDDAVNRYEAADEHDSDHYRALRKLLEALEQTPV